MKVLIWFLYVVNIIFSLKATFSDSLSVEEPQTCQIFQPTLPLYRLKNHIFCDYEPSIRPSKQGQNTTVNILLFPKTINYVPTSNKFTLNSMLHVNWMDEHLKWNPDDFDKIFEIHVSHDQIWVPDLSVWNSADLNSDMIFSSTTSCLVLYTGYVLCIPKLATTVHCSSDFENWPFEKQICKVVFSSYFHFNEEISLNSLVKNVVRDSLMPHQEWNIINTTITSRIDLLILPRIIYEFHLKRHSGMILTIVPLIVLMIFTLTILWMDVNSVERMALIGLNFMSHLFCLYDLQLQISENGNRTPRLLTLYEYSLALTAFSMILTILLRKLNAKTSSPMWISSIASYVLKHRIARLFILNNEETKCFVENEDDGDENNLEYISKTAPKNVWKHFAKIIECLSFFSIFLIYIIMIFTYLPK